MKGTYAVAIMSALMLSACAGGSTMSASSPTPRVSTPSNSPDFSTSAPASPGRTQGSADGRAGQAGQGGQGTGGSGGQGTGGSGGAASGGQGTGNSSGQAGGASGG